MLQKIGLSGILFCEHSLTNCIKSYASTSSSRLVSRFK